MDLFYIDLFYMDDETKDEFKFLMKKFTEDSQRACSTRINQSLHHTLSKLSQDSTMKFAALTKEMGLQF